MLGECLLFHPPAPIDKFGTVLLVGLFALILYVARFRQFYGRPFFLVSLIGAIIWLASSVLEHRAIEATCKFEWGDYGWAGVTLMSISLYYFVRDHAHARDNCRSIGRWATLLASTVILWASAETNDWHGLMYGPDAGIDPASPNGQLVYEAGPFFYVGSIYIYCFVLAGVAVLVRGLVGAHPTHRPFFVAWLLVMIAPVGANLAFLSGKFALSELDPSPFAYAMAMMILALFIVTDRMLDLRSIGTDMMFRNSPFPIVILTPGGRVAAASPIAQTRFGAVRDYQRLQDWPALAPHVPLFFAPPGGPEQTLHLCGHSYALRILPMEKPLDSKDEMGRLLVFHDVTEREALEARLAAERDYLHLLMQTTMTGVVALDAEGKVVFANAEAGKLTGIRATEIPGLDHSALFPPIEGCAETCTGCFSAVIGAAGRQRGMQVRFQRADGETRTLSVNVAHIDRPGVEARVVCALADITEELKAARSLEAARARAEAANRTKSQFLANMSHEIRTPLNGVLGMAEVLEDSLNDPGKREMARTIRDSGATLLSILNDILDMSKMEAGKMQIETVAFDPAQITMRIQALHAGAARDKGLVFEVAGPDDDAPVRRGDPHRILQVVHNLVGNAIKFTETGTVRVRLQAAPGAPVMIEVRDTGIGMSPEQAARVFAEFEQADGSIARRFGGTGLGMTITKALVEQMQGEITLETEPGRGTCVRVTLPLAEIAAGEAVGKPAPDRRADRRDSARVSLDGISILAADDNATNRKVLSLMLSRAGARVRIVEGGQAALESWQPGAFDLVLLDISMPDMDGIATLAALRVKAEQSGAPPPLALAITANVMSHQIEEYRAAGFAGHAGKPFQSARLTAEVARLADQGRPAGRVQERLTAAG